jgi:hypothetical protein
MVEKLFHKGEKVCLSHDYLNEEVSFKTGQHGTVRRYDGFLVVVKMENSEAIAVHPKGLILLSDN